MLIEFINREDNKSMIVNLPDSIPYTISVGAVQDSPYYCIFVKFPNNLMENQSQTYQAIYEGTEEKCRAVYERLKTYLNPKRLDEI